jgi:predicted metal-dependent hydrolase
MYNHPMKIDQVIRSKRKTFSLEIKPDGRLVVRAPQSASRAHIQAVVDQKAQWVAKTRARLAKQFQDISPRTFTAGEKFWYLGQQYTLRLTDRQRPLLDLDGDFRLSRKAKKQARELFIAWYREETRQITQDLIHTYTQRYGFKVKQVRITSARTRWGSCSSKNNLNFTYRLCMAPLDVIEYVVVHELVHLRIRNHSRAFWQAVEQIKPDYRTQRTWLKRNGALLTLD